MPLAVFAAPHGSDNQVCSRSQPPPFDGYQIRVVGSREDTKLRSTPNTQHPLKLALASHREMQMGIGQRLRTERELPQELPPELTALVRRDKEHDPYADIVGTC